MDFEWAVAFLALTAMEVVLGIDNIVFLAIVTARLPEAQRPLARRIGLFLALGMRIALLCAIKWVMSLDDPVFDWTEWGIPASWFAELDHPQEASGVSVRDLILLVGGLFLIGHSVSEIHHKLDVRDDETHVQPVSSFGAALFQIVVFDIIFSLDSVITAVGMADQLPVMIAAVTVAILIMLLFANRVSDFVSRHPSITMLALSFLILIGVMLVAEGAGTHIDKGYIYFAMAFSLVVEMLNLRFRSRADAANSTS